MKGLTPIQEMFCREYVVDQNGTQAAIRAGYAERGAAVQASRLLTKPKIQSTIAELTKRRHARLELKADQILERLLRIADVDLVDILDDGGNLKPLSEIPVTARKAVASVESNEKGTKVKIADRLKALELIGKHLKLFTDRIEVEGTVNIADRIHAAQVRVTPLPPAAPPPAEEPKP